MLFPKLQLQVVSPCGLSAHRLADVVPDDHGSKKKKSWGLTAIIHVISTPILGGIGNCGSSARTKSD